ncbi:MAG: DUF3859 domain-containing protein [Puniceicoccales bacterium]
MRFYSAAGLVLLLLAGWMHRAPFTMEPYFHGHVVRVGEGETFVAPDSPNGLGMDSDWYIVDGDTWTIPNCIGHGLGLEMLIHNVPNDVTELRFVLDFPPMTLPNGETNSRTERMVDIFVDDRVGYFEYYYFFDYEYEASPGDWRFRLYHGDKLLFDEAFTVVLCEE